MTGIDVAGGVHKHRHQVGGADPLAAADIGAVDAAAVGAAGGVAALDGSSKLPVGQVPDLSSNYALRHQVNVMAYGAVANSNGTVGNGTDNATAFTAAFAAAATLGYGVHVPPGKYRLTSSLTVPKGAVLSGDGAGHTSDKTSAVSMLVFDNGVNGVILGGLGAQCVGLMLVGGTTGAVNGVTVADGRTRCVDLSIIGFGQDGYNCDTSVTGNFNLPFCSQVRTYQCGRDGFHIAGPNSNAGTFIACEAVGNANYGIYNVACARSNWVGAHLSTNTVGGIFDGANSSVYDVYVESGTGGTLNVDAASSYGLFWGRNYAMPTITGSTTAQLSWQISKNGTWRGQVYVGDINDNTSTGKTWKMSSGAFGAGWLELVNSTDSVRLMRAQTGASVQAVWYTPMNPDATNTRDLGTSAIRWRDLYLSGTLHLPTYTTAGRPSASTAGVGGAYYDTTLSKPGYSDGTAWRDAAGTTI